MNRASFYACGQIPLESRRDACVSTVDPVSVPGGIMLQFQSNPPLVSSPHMTLLAEKSSGYVAIPYPVRVSQGWFGHQWAYHPHS